MEIGYGTSHIDKPEQLYQLKPGSQGCGADVWPLEGQINTTILIPC